MTGVRHFVPTTPRAARVSPLRPRPLTERPCETPLPAARRADSPRLSPRESDVLLSWIRNDNKSDVGAELHLSVGTVNTYLSRVRAKYAAVGRAAPTKASLLARALQDGLIALDDL